MDRVHDVIIISDCSDVIEKIHFWPKNNVMEGKIVGR